MLEIGRVLSKVLAVSLKPMVRRDLASIYELFQPPAGKYRISDSPIYLMRANVSQKRVRQ